MNHSLAFIVYHFSKFLNIEMYNERWFRTKSDFLFLNFDHTKIQSYISIIELMGSFLLETCMIIVFFKWFQKLKRYYSRKLYYHILLSFVRFKQVVIYYFLLLIRQKICFALGGFWSWLYNQLYTHTLIPYVCSNVLLLNRKLLLQSRNYLNFYQVENYLNTTKR